MKTAILPDSSQFAFVPESNDNFLKLFSHRHDYIWSPHTSQAAWQTESRHPLSDRLIKQGAFLYDVRFGAETNYAMIDLDHGGLYHPARDPFAVDRILAALEPLGLVAHIAITSSHSGGIHLYFPFEQPEKTWRIALAVKVALENAGFLIKQGTWKFSPTPNPTILRHRHFIRRIVCPCRLALICSTAAGNPATPRTLPLSHVGSFAKVATT